MTGSVRAVSIPPRLPVTGPAGERSGFSPLSVPDLSCLDEGAGPWVFGAALVDGKGRVSEGRVVRALGWQSGDRLTITVVDRSVLLHRRADGAFVMSATPYVTVPAAARARSGVRAGQRVLVAADVAHDVLVVHPPSAVAAMLAGYHAGLAGGETR
ncbi:hypothetical protein [Saccharomonospora saliphila]|uniref:hypothetical protein n=1 Tax=Saccharomonospora saliphila TaxID=369829 RepID=UPI000367DD43|nr:hypothetical protein [Saccharomonospora saliphila]